MKSRGMVCAFVCVVLAAHLAHKGTASADEKGGRKLAKTLERSCYRGSLDDCVRAAEMHLEGHGVAKDEAKASELFDYHYNKRWKSCTGTFNSAKSCAVLADMYREGRWGVEKDERQALHWLRSACPLGGPYANRIPASCVKLGERSLAGARPVLESRFWEKNTESTLLEAAQYYSFACTPTQRTYCTAVERAWYELATETRNTEKTQSLLEGYLERYPNGTYALSAQQKLASIEAEKAAALERRKKAAREKDERDCELGDGVACYRLGVPAKLALGKKLKKMPVDGDFYARNITVERTYGGRKYYARMPSSGDVRNYIDSSTFLIRQVTGLTKGRKHVIAHWRAGTYDVPFLEPSPGDGTGVVAVPKEILPCNLEFVGLSTKRLRLTKK